MSESRHDDSLFGSVFGKGGVFDQVFGPWKAGVKTTTTTTQPATTVAARGCYECKFWHHPQTNASHGDCRRNAPDVSIGKWPRTRPHDWCGEGVKQDVR